MSSGLQKRQALVRELIALGTPQQAHDGKPCPTCTTRAPQGIREGTIPCCSTARHSNDPTKLQRSQMLLWYAASSQSSKARPVRTDVLVHDHSRRCPRRRQSVTGASVPTPPDAWYPRGRRSPWFVREAWPAMPESSSHADRRRPVGCETRLSRNLGRVAKMTEPQGELWYQAQRVSCGVSPALNSGDPSNRSRWRADETCQRMLAATAKANFTCVCRAGG